MTCSVREGAERKIWRRLEFLKSLKLARQRLRSSRLPPVKIGILGSESKLACNCLMKSYINFMTGITITPVISISVEYFYTTYFISEHLWPGDNNFGRFT